jgi:sporulation protein YlmC with PRC-barrel domain
MFGVVRRRDNGYVMRTARQLRKAGIVGIDGPFGSVSDLYFDSESWSIRYVIVDTGKWLPGRRVLISPDAIVAEKSTEDTLRLNLTRKQIEGSPDVAVDQPVSRQIESMLYTYYGWPAYWSAGPSSGALLPGAPATLDPAPPPLIPESEPNPYLRSMEEVVGYHIQAVDGEIGHVEDFILDADVRNVSVIVVDTRNWLPGKKVAIPPRWIDQVDWEEQRVKLHVPRSDVAASPEYHAIQEVIS